MIEFVSYRAFMKEHLISTAKHALGTENIDIEQTDWIEQCGDDFILVHNPVFKVTNCHPYKLDMVLAIICDGGCASGSINLKPYTLHKNGMMIVLADHIVESHNISPDFKGTYIFMSPSFLASLNIGDGYKFYENIETDACFQLDDRMFNAVTSYINMSKAMINISDQNPNIMESLILLTRLFFLNLGWFIHQEAFSRNIPTHQSVVMDRFISAVKAGYREHRDVEYYADKMNMTAKYLTTMVKKASGKSALRWIEDYVILDAKTRLSSTMNSVQQISYELNFPTQAFFYRYFKRATGMSPSDYRRSIISSGSRFNRNHENEP